MTKTMTLEEIKMVSGGTLMDELINITGGVDKYHFDVGARVVYVCLGWAGTVKGYSSDYGTGMFYYVVKFDNGQVYYDLPQTSLRAE